MFIKVEETYEKTGSVQNNDEYKKYMSRGERNARHYDEILSESNEEQRKLYRPIPCFS